MIKYVSVAEMKSIEREADASGLTYEQMMENAGLSLAKQINIAYMHTTTKSIVALVGSGNNGGDALVALSYLASWGWMARAYFVGTRPEDDQLVMRLISGGGMIVHMEGDQEFTQLSQLLMENDVLVDGVFGTGIRLPLKGKAAGCINYVKHYLLDHGLSTHVWAVDCPSGIDCDTGETAEETIPADVTLTMAAVKQGLLRLPAYQYIGELRIGDIGNLDHLPTWSSINRTVAMQNSIKEVMPTRSLDAHKGTFGTALIVAGSSSYTGAALMAGKAAYRVGAGLVTMAVPSLLHPILAGQLLEATWLLLPHERGAISAKAAQVLLPVLEKVTGMLVGPGLGLESTTLEFMERVFSNNSSTKLPPLVIDADGLKLITRIPNWHNILPSLSILTPHPGEMAVLTGLSSEEIQTNRLDIAECFSKEWGHVVVLKGAFTVIASPDGRTAIIPIATSALSKAGTGDVLAGLIVGLRAQGVEAYNAALAGAWIHGRAGIEAGETVGNNASVLAGDVLESTVKVISSLCM